MTNDRYEFFKNEWPARHIFFYHDRITEEATTTADRQIALEKLITCELKLDEESLSKWSEFKEFEDTIKKLQSSDLNDKERIEKEYFALAPLWLLWGHVRDTQTLEGGREWLIQAVQTAMTTAEPHETEGCDIKDVGEESQLLCELSPLCPFQAAGLVLLEPIWNREIDLMDQIEGPGILRKRLNVHLEIATREGLTTAEHSKELLAQFDKRRQPLISKEDFDE